VDRHQFAQLSAVSLAAALTPSAALAAAPGLLGSGPVLDPVEPTPVAFTQDESEAAAAAEEEAVPAYWAFHKWDGSAGVGINGSSGNNERFNFRANVRLERESEHLDSAIRFFYTYANEEGEVTEQAARVFYGNTWNFDGSPWSAFNEYVYEYDEFQNWQHRVQIRGGAGYDFVDNEKHKLTGRAGLSATKNLRGDELAWRPEALLGVRYDWDISEKQDFSAGSDVFLDLSDAGEARVESFAEWSIVLDEETNLNLVTGVLHRYDTQPGGDSKRSDLDYYAVLAWTW